MKYLRIISILCLILVHGGVSAGNSQLNHFRTLASLDGDWVLSGADVQEGGATMKGPAAKLVGAGKTPIC